MNDAPLVWIVILVVVVFAPIVYVINIFNRLVRLRTLIANSWSNIDTELKRRHDLIPRLVEVVKGYAAHERDVLERIMEARERAVRSDTGAADRRHQEDESALAREARRLFALAEGYPDLKASSSFLELQQALVETEDRIAAARRFFNGNVKDLNTLVEQFPSNLIANAFGFESASYFEIETVFEREPVAVRFT